MALRALQARANGNLTPSRLEAALAYARAAELAESGDIVAQGSRLFARSNGSAALLCLKLDCVSSRFLLATDARSGVHLYDAAATMADDSANSGGIGGVEGSGGCGVQLATSTRPSSPLYADARLPTGHESAVTGAAWYGADAGLFLTCGLDSRVLAWDASRFAPAYAWEADGPAYCVDLRAGGGSTATLAAVATVDPRLRLLDVRTCAFAHSLLGHTAAVLAAAWLPAHDFLLASGSRDGTLRIWDVRRSGAQATLGVADVASLPRHSTPDRLAAAAAAAAPLHPAAPTTATAAIAHAGGVNCVLPLDAPALGVWGGVGGGRAAATGGGGGASAPAPVRAAVASTALPEAGALLRTHILSTGMNRRAQVWDILLAGASVIGKSDDDDSLAVSVVPAPAVLPPVLGGGRRCVYAAAARVGPALPRIRVASAAGAALPAAGPLDVVLFVPSSDVAAGGGAAEFGTGGGRSLPGVFSAPGRILAIDAATGRTLATLRGHLGPVNAVAYRDSAQELFSAGSDGAVLLWQTPLINHCGSDGDGFDGHDQSDRGDEKLEGGGAW